MEGRLSYERGLIADPDGARRRLTLAGAASSDLPARLRLLWTAEIGESVESSAAIVDGTVYVGAQPGVLAAIDLQSGAIKWKYQASDAGLGESSPAVANGVVYVGDLAGATEYGKKLIGWGKRVFIRFRPQRSTTWDFREG